MLKESERIRIKTIDDVFKKPKERPSENQVAGIVYKVECRSCSLVYIGEAKRSCNSRGGAQDWHKRKQDAEMTDRHGIHANYIDILERGVSNRQKRLLAFHYRCCK